MRQWKKKMVEVRMVEIPISGFLFNHFLSPIHTADELHLWINIFYKNIQKNILLGKKNSEFTTSELHIQNTKPLKINLECLWGRRVSWLPFYFCDKTPWLRQLKKKVFNWADGFRGLESMMAEQRCGGRNSWELTSWSTSRMERVISK